MTSSTILLVGTLILGLTHVQGLDNGLARTPPMGWLSWTQYACELDCKKYPGECIDENLYKQMADLLVDEGYLNAGYEYVNIDDCWSELGRDPSTKMLIPDKHRFKSGIKSLADYIHDKGLKVGIYTDMGETTCAKYPALLNHNGEPEFFDLDSKLFASWGIDSLKVDGCFGNTSNFDQLFPQFGKSLQASGRQILYSCEWPLYQRNDKITPNYEEIAKHCNLWRNYDDVALSWASVQSIVDFYANNYQDFYKHQGPGAWFDPDMIIVGSFGLSHDQARAQMALWSMMSAPLYMSNDLRNIDPEMKKILLNKDVIAIDQDPKGVLAERVYTKDKKEVWVKEVTSSLNLTTPDYAVVYFYRAELGSGQYMEHKLSDILANRPQADHYYAFDLFNENRFLGKLNVHDTLELKVNPTGVRMVRLIAAP